MAATYTISYSAMTSKGSFINGTTYEVSETEPKALHKAKQKLKNDHPDLVLDSLRLFVSDKLEEEDEP